MSSSSLLLCSVCARLPGAEEGSADEPPLLAFSLPVALAEQPAWSAARRVWAQGVRGRAAAARARCWDWRGLRVEDRRQQPRPVAL